MVYGLGVRVSKRMSVEEVPEKSDELPCTEEVDRHRIAIALSATNQIRSTLSQKDAHTWIAVNRLMRATAFFPKGKGVGGDEEMEQLQVFSIFARGMGDISDKTKWTVVKFGAVRLLIDHYSARVVLDGVIAKRWVPAGCSDDDGFFGIEMVFVNVDDDEVEPLSEEEIRVKLGTKHDQICAAFVEIYGPQLLRGDRKEDGGHI